MKKKVLLMLAVLLLPCAFLLSACGEQAKASRIIVEMLNNDYLLNNNEITIEWGEKIEFDETDFRVTVEFDNDISKVITREEAGQKGYSFSTTLPSDANLEDGKTPIGHYTVTFSYEELENYVIAINVVQKEVVLENLTWTDSSNFVYDGNEKTVLITSELPNYVDVQYEDNVKANAGNYTATANFSVNDNHYSLLTESTSHNWEIQKAEVSQAELQNIALVQNAFTYTENLNQVQVDNATLPAGFQAEIISGGSATSAGNYTAVISLTPSNNYNKPQNINLAWTIAKADINVQNVALQDNNLEYNGQLLTVALDPTTIPNGLTAQIVSGGSATEPGNYNAEVSFTLRDSENYNSIQNIILPWQISKATAKFVSVPVAKTLTYAGKAQELVQAGTTNDGTVQYIVKSVNGEALIGAEYSKNIPTMTNAGTYVVGYKIVADANHFDLAEQELTVTIQKADVEVQNVSLMNNQIQYSGRQVVVELDDETLPAGCITQIVSGDRATNAGTYNANVEFSNIDENNYNIPNSIQLLWRIVPARLQITPLVVGEVICGNDVELSYEVSGLLGSDTEADVLSGEAVYDLGGYNKETSAPNEEFELSISGLTANDNYQLVTIKTRFHTKKAYFEWTNNGTTKYLENLDGITQSGTYKFLDDYEIDCIMIGGQDYSNLEVVIDLNNHVLSSTNLSIEAVIYFDDATEDSVVEIKNGTISARTSNNVIDLNNNNTVNLSSMSIMDEYGTGVYMYGENCILNCSATIQAVTAIGYYGGTLNITDGTYVGYVYISAGNASISGGYFKRNLYVYGGHTEFITGGKFVYYLNDSYLNNFYESHWTYGNNGESFYEVTVKPDIVNVVVEKATFVLGLDENYDNFEIVVYYSDNSWSSGYLGGFADRITVETQDDLSTTGNKNFVFTAHNLNGDVQFEGVAEFVIVSYFGYVEDNAEFVYDTMSVYNYPINVIISNGDVRQVYLSECIDNEQITAFENAEHYNGENYTFHLSYGGWEDDFYLVLSALQIIEVKLCSPRQCLTINPFNYDFIVKFNDGSEYYYSLQNDNRVRIDLIRDNDNNPYNSIDELTEIGTYYFTLSIEKDEVYNEITEQYEKVYYETENATLDIVAETEPAELGVLHDYVVVGQKPIFYYRTFAGQDFDNQDIFDQVDIIDGEFDYNTVGNYEVTFSYKGAIISCSIAVHNGDDAKYIYLYNSNYYMSEQNKLQIKVETYDEDLSYKVDLLDEYITAGSVDYSKKGSYNVVITYQGLTTTATINVVDYDDTQSIYFSNSYYKLNNGPIKFRNYTYGGNNSYVELTEDMIVSGQFPDLTKVGEYRFRMIYNGYSYEQTITVYDPNDETINIMYLDKNSFVWTYTKENDDIVINENFVGNYIYVERANRTKEYIQITKDMISYDLQSVKNEINSNPDYAATSFTVSYNGRTLNATARLVLESDLNEFINNGYVSVYKNGETLYSDVRINIKDGLDGLEVAYYYNGYYFFKQITAEDVINKATNENQDLTQAGVYDVTICGQDRTIYLYDEKDAEIEIRTNETISIVENSSLEALKNMLVGLEAKVNYEYEYPYHGSKSYYSYSKDFVLTEENMDFSKVDFATVGRTNVIVNYGGIILELRINVIPNVQGQTKHTYTVVHSYGNSRYDFYDEYYCSYGEYWYKYEIVDNENNIYLLSGELYVLNVENNTLTELKGSMVGGEPVVYTGEFQGNHMQIKVYGGHYAEIYEYNNETTEFDYDTTIWCEYSSNGDKNYIVLADMKFIIGEENVLTMEITGQMVYSYEIMSNDEVPHVQMRAEFMDDNGEKTMYYYGFDDETEQLALQGTLTWEINQEGTLITCYYQGFQAVQFVVENGVIVSMVE